jgi:hypothetical protein
MQAFAARGYQWIMPQRFPRQPLSLALLVVSLAVTGCAKQDAVSDAAPSSGDLTTSGDLTIVTVKKDGTMSVEQGSRPQSFADVTPDGGVKVHACDAAAVKLFDGPYFSWDEICFVLEPFGQVTVDLSKFQRVARDQYGMVLRDQYGMVLTLPWAHGTRSYVSGSDPGAFHGPGGDEAFPANTMVGDAPSAVRQATVLELARPEIP